MTELDRRVGDDTPQDPTTEPHVGLPDAVVRMDLRRSRQASSGAELHPRATMFAARLARAVGEPAWAAVRDIESVTEPRAMRLVTPDGAGLVRVAEPNDPLFGELPADPYSGGLSDDPPAGRFAADPLFGELAGHFAADSLFADLSGASADPAGASEAGASDAEPAESWPGESSPAEPWAVDSAGSDSAGSAVAPRATDSGIADVEAADSGAVDPLGPAGVLPERAPDRPRRRALDRLRHADQRFVDLMAMVPVGVAMLEPSGRVIDANPALCVLLDLPLEELRGTAAAALEPGPALDGLPGWLRPVPLGAEHGYALDATPLRRRDGTSVWCELAVSATPADGGSWFWLVVCTDVSDRRRAAELLRRAGTVDELTRLPNRAASLELVDRLLAGPGRDRVAVVCGDLDDFARVNSSLGHEVGDDLLVGLAGRLQRELPVGCTAARLSGDEFVVICADHAEVGGPDQLARTVADLLRTTITVHGRPVQLTASVGLATPVPTGEVRAADLLRFAEVAMHDVKRRQSRGGIGMATDGVVSSATRALELEAELRAAIAGGGLLLEYQPVVGPDGEVLSAEALVRWPHPERGLIAPGDFLPLAQRCGLLRDLDLWVLRTAVAEATTWPGRRPPSIAVNLAGLLPGDGDFLAVVTGIVQDSGLAWDRLVLELVETSLVALPPHALAAMAQLVDRGVRFAVDDFGTGYSSLARLKELPAQTVKIDRAFVTGVAEDSIDFAVARAVVGMARAMGRSTVAEGVETSEQFHVLRTIGVDAYQGWLFARPLPAHALADLLRLGRVPTPAVLVEGL